MEVRRSQRKLNGPLGSRSDAQFADLSMENRTGLLLVLLLALVLLLTGSQPGPDVYLAQATNHAIAGDVEQVLGRPTSDQALETAQRRWPYHREGDGTGGVRHLRAFPGSFWHVLTYWTCGLVRVAHAS